MTTEIQKWYDEQRIQSMHTRIHSMYTLIQSMNKYYIIQYLSYIILLYNKQYNTYANININASKNKSTINLTWISKSKEKVK